jgi:glycosyltransferase involved in cell wall biosynthesis
MKSNPFFSIVIPTYNRAHLIEKTLHSILNQTFQDFEVLIIDDGSTDNTSEVLAPYLSVKVQYYWQNNAERNAARNKGTQLAKGKYINWFDSDDIALPNHLDIFHQFIISNNYPKAVHSLFDEIDTDGNQVKNYINLPDSLNSILYKGNCISSNNIIVDRSFALKNPFEENRYLLSEDYEMWIRFASYTTIFNIPVHTSSIICHNNRSVYNSKSKEALIMGYTMFLDLIKKNKDVVCFFGLNYDYFIMKNYLILSVELVHNGCKREALYYLYKAMQSSYRFFLDKSFYSIIKKMLF